MYPLSRDGLRPEGLTIIALAGAAALAATDVLPQMALTHPARFRISRDAIAQVHLKVYCFWSSFAD